MPREIDKDVNAVTINCFCRRLCREVCEISEMFDRTLYVLRIAILRVLRINCHLKPCGVERRHQGIRKGEHNVLPDIR